MADGAGRVPVAAEVAAFEGEVGSDKEFVAGRRCEDGAVVADAEAQMAMAASSGGADARDQGEFARHESVF